MPYEEVIIVPFTPGNKERTFRIGTKLGNDHQRRLITLIREFEDVFAWGPEDMPGIDSAVTIRKLYSNPTFSPIKQKKRFFNDEKNTAITEEKPNNKWRMCTNFTNLNKACPKDFYPLPCLGRLVDGSAGHKVFDFMDASWDIIKSV
ncbi:hypothetical protein LIER_19528 [Lithospermum erythrorhizon]|uniref:Uncharacterized protein n=1 Tax=Lithospermum erythrorhizon TaxID=34254 RepID=A0AAV3QJ66_LITER